MNRRKILINGGLLTLAATSGVGLSLPRSAAAMEIHDDDRILGNADAPITIIEFASLTCPHCAEFHSDTFPQLKETWIADGRARMVFRHFPLDALALRAAALTECYEGDFFFSFLDVLFQQQSNWSRAQDPIAALRGLSQQTGMSAADFEACITNEKTLDRILAKLVDARDNLEIRATPSFIINGEKIEGGRSFQELESILQKI